MKIDDSIKSEVESDYIIAKAKMEVVRSASDIDEDSIKTFTKELISFSDLVNEIREDIFTRMKHIQSKECAEKVLDMIYLLDAEENKLDDGITPSNGKEISTASIKESIDNIFEKYEIFRKSVRHYGMILPEYVEPTHSNKPNDTEDQSGLGLPQDYVYSDGHVFKDADTRTPDTFTNLNVLNDALAEKHSNFDSSTKAVQRYYYSK